MIPFFFFNYTPTTEIYTLSLHDALPISPPSPNDEFDGSSLDGCRWTTVVRSEEHTSELQSRPHLVCRLLLETKKKLLNGFTVWKMQQVILIAIAPSYCI